jgi:hypothetical protein
MELTTSTSERKTPPSTQRKSLYILVTVQWMSIFSTLLAPSGVSINLWITCVAGQAFSILATTISLWMKASERAKMEGAERPDAAGNEKGKQAEAQASGSEVKLTSTKELRLSYLFVSIQWFSLCIGSKIYVPQMSVDSWLSGLYLFSTVVVGLLIILYSINLWKAASAEEKKEREEQVQEALVEKS